MERWDTCHGSSDTCTCLIGPSFFPGIGLDKVRGLIHLRRVFREVVLQTSQRGALQIRKGCLYAFEKFSACDLGARAPPTF